MKRILFLLIVTAVLLSVACDIEQTGELTVVNNTSYEWVSFYLSEDSAMSNAQQILPFDLPSGSQAICEVELGSYSYLKIGYKDPNHVVETPAQTIQSILGIATLDIIEGENGTLTINTINK